MRSMASLLPTLVALVLSTKGGDTDAAICARFLAARKGARDKRSQHSIV